MLHESKTQKDSRENTCTHTRAPPTLPQGPHQLLQFLSLCAEGAGTDRVPALPAALFTRALFPSSADTWWTWAFHFVLCVAVFALLINGLYAFRVGLIALLAIDLMLMMDTTNTFLALGRTPTSNTFYTRTRVTFAGALISSASLFMLITCLGLHDEASVFAPGKPSRVVNLTADTQIPTSRAVATPTGDAAAAADAARV